MAVVAVVEPIGVDVMLVSGASGPDVTCQVSLAGLASVRPFADARTANVWLPTPRPLYDFGLVQAANAALSRLHSNVEPAWSAVNANVAVVAVVEPIGVDVMLVSGATGPPLPTVQLSVAGVASVPFDVAARTRKVCVPFARPV
jgi:hypothetical protein